MIISFASGYVLYFLLALLQIPVVRCLIKQRRPYLHGFVSNLFHLIAFVSVVQIWRSLWIACEQYLNIPGYHNLTLWLCYGVSFIVLTCGLAACSLNGPGGSKDTYIDEGPILLFKFDYFSSLLRVSRSRCLFVFVDVQCGGTANSMHPSFIRRENTPMRVYLAIHRRIRV